MRENRRDRENGSRLKQKQIICVILAGVLSTAAAGCGGGIGSGTKNKEDHAGKDGRRNRLWQN